MAVVLVPGKEFRKFVSVFGYVVVDLIMQLLRPVCNVFPKTTGHSLLPPTPWQTQDKRIDSD